MNVHVGFNDCDAYNVVHNSRYMAWIEDALYDAMSDETGNEKRLMITSVKSKYIGSALQNMDLDIQSEIEKIDEKEYKFSQKMTDKGTGKLLNRSSGFFLME